MFAKSGRKGNVRKRDRGSDDEDGGSAVVRKDKGPAKSALSATTVGQKKKNNDAVYESNRSVMPTIGIDKSATAPSAEELEDMMGDRKSAAVAKQWEEGGVGGNLYRGEANRQQLKEKREIINKAANSVGPIKAPTNVRMTCRFDYQPDLCKDWKETGYCGFGDACKFMHDRGDYKAGWEIERDWNAQQEKKKMEEAVREMEGEKPVEVDDGLPFACAICRGPFNSPVETKCMHYFCERCAFAHHAQSRRCFICNEQTYGQFNTAHKLVAKIARIKGASHAEEKKQEAAAAHAAAGTKEEDDDEAVFAAYQADESARKAEAKADIGWQMPGNTFAEGKKI